MMASIPAYNEYAKTVLMPAMDQAVLAEMQRIEAAEGLREPALHGAADADLLRQHILRMPPTSGPIR